MNVSRPGSRWHAAVDKRRWRAVRRTVFDLDGWRCRPCGKAGRMEVDHVTPLHKDGDPWAESDLQTLCRGCHIEKTRQEMRASRWSPSPHGCGVRGTFAVGHGKANRWP